jgi:hypothetical protein
MPFVESARAAAGQLPRENQTRVVLDYLLQHGVGRGNARPWPQIEAHLNANGIFITREVFQQTILAESRSGDIFIGSNDHGASRGYFLIQDPEDAHVAREFYTRRIAAQQANLDRLDALIQQQWPQQQNTGP